MPLTIYGADSNTPTQYKNIAGVINNTQAGNIGGLVTHGTPYAPADTEANFGAHGLVGYIGRSPTAYGTALNVLTNPVRASVDHRLAVGTDTPLFHATFTHSAINTSRWTNTNTTMTVTYTGYGMVLNGGSSVATTVNALVQTKKFFPVVNEASLRFSTRIALSQNPQTNNLTMFGLGIGSATALSDGAVFRITTAGVWQAVVSAGGSEQTANITWPIGETDLAFAANTVYEFAISLNPYRAEFFINNILVAYFKPPASGAGICNAAYLPMTFSTANTAATTLAQQLKVYSATAVLTEWNTSRLWSTTQTAMGKSCVQGFDGGTVGQLANYANSAAPASATLSNTAAGYTTLGGQWQFAAVAGAETDYALFAWQNPAGSLVVPGADLIVRGIRIEAVNTGAAVATTATLLQWALSVGTTAVSLATAEASNAKAPRRIALGLQSFAIGAAIGQTANPVDVNMDAPLVVHPGEYLHVILKMPLGTATASQIVRGTCFINGHFE